LSPARSFRGLPRKPRVILTLSRMRRSTNQWRQDESP